MIGEVEEYTANAIRVLKPEETIERFDWVRTGEWASGYPHVPAEFISRAIEACRRAGVDLEYIKHRYLDGDLSVPLNEAVDEQMRQILREASDARQADITRAVRRANEEVFG